MEKKKQYFGAEGIKRYLANTPQITFEVTDSCNLDCVYCGYGKLYSDFDTRGNKFLPVENAITLLNYLYELWSSPLNKSANSNVYIGFYGGEPLLNFPFIVAIVDYLKNEVKFSLRTFTFSITTNAMLLDKYMYFMVENNFDILISLDGDRHCNSYRVDKRGNDAFSRIIQNVNKLRDKYPDYFESKVISNNPLKSNNYGFNIRKQLWGKAPQITGLSYLYFRFYQLQPSPPTRKRIRNDRAYQFNHCHQCQRKQPARELQTSSGFPADCFFKNHGFGRKTPFPYQRSNRINPSTARNQQKHQP